MTETGFFPPPDNIIAFEEPEPSKWTVVAKHAQQNFQKDEDDFRS